MKKHSLLLGVLLIGATNPAQAMLRRGLPLLPQVVRNAGQSLTSQSPRFVSTGIGGASSSSFISSRSFATKPPKSTNGLGEDPSCMFRNLNFLNNNPLRSLRSLFPNEKGESRLVQDLRDKNPLLFAARHGDFELVQKLLASGFNPNFKATGFYPLLEAQTSEIMKALIVAGADVTVDYFGDTVLHKAIFNDFVDCMKLLVLAGADLEAREWRHGRTPLHLAVRLHRADCVRELLALGANINARDEDENTTMDILLKELSSSYFFVEGNKIFEPGDNLKPFQSPLYELKQIKAMLLGVDARSNKESVLYKKLFCIEEEECSHGGAFY